MIFAALNSDRQTRYLEITELHLAPNPFTPNSIHNLNEQEEGQGLRISFKVDTQARFVWVTVRIFNIRGNLVRTITELEPVYSNRGPEDTGEPLELIYWWNGMTNFNRLAQNGRYILHLKVSDSEAENFYEEKLATVVLVK
jgi:hypothetical protein